MIIITLILLFQGVYSQSITVTPNTTSIDILEGGNFSIEYKIDPGRLSNWSVEMNFGYTSHAFFIHRDGQPYTPPDGCLNCNVTYNNLTKTFTLHLCNVTKDNSGSYEFKLKCPYVYRILHRMIYVHVREIPDLSTSDLYSLEFTNLALNCSINTDWYYKMWWTTSNGSTINSCYRSYGHNFQTCPAVLSNVTRERQGFYTCHAENRPYYSINKTISLDIAYGPQYSTQLLITKGLESYLSTTNITVKEGDILNLSCAADCNPNCNYTWNNNNGDGSYLTVKADRKIEYITCTTENQYGVDNASVKVNVLYLSEITNFTTLNGKTTVNESGKITIKCSAVGNPKPNIIWSMEGTNTSYKKEQCSKYKPGLKSDGSQCEHLLLEDLDCFGTGNYTCISVNGIGNTNDSKTISIVVNCKPKILQPKKKLVKVHDNWMSFNVHFTGFPVPKVTLHDANNTNIANNDILNTKSNVHTIDLVVLLKNSSSGLKTGNYKLKMWNELGKDYLDIQLMSHKHSEVVPVNIYIVVLLHIFCFVLPIYIVVMCKRSMRKRRNATDNRAEESRDQSDTDIRNIYSNSVREIELAALRPYEDLSINVEIPVYEDVNQVRECAISQDLARANSNEHGSANSSVSGRDIDEDGYLNMIEHQSPAICIRQDPKEQDSAESYVSGSDKDADGYLIMRGQNIPNFCKGSDKKSTGSIQNKQYADDDGYIQMEAQNARRNKEKASNEIGNIDGSR